MTDGGASAAIEVGERYSTSFRVSVERVRRFTDFSGDTNPLHTDDDVARRLGFRKSIAHGAILLA